MRVLAACSLGGVGHLQPLLPFLDAARAQRHETLVVGPPALTEMAATTGHPFAAGGEPPESVVAAIREQLPVVPADEAAALANRELFGHLATEAMLPAMRGIIERWQPDVVLRDPCEYASAIAAHGKGIVTAQIGISLAQVEWGSLDIAAPALEARCSGIVDELRDSPYVTRFPASLDPSPFPDTRRFCEPMAAASRALPDWWDGADAPLVYVSFGTVLGYMPIAVDVYRVALQALAEVDARVLVTVGRRLDPSQLAPLPANIHVEPWVDQADVLTDAALVVSHGGSGTTLGALRAGIPLVVVPLFADQRVNARTIVEAGAGVLVEIGRDDDGVPRELGAYDTARIAAAIETVRGRSSYREHARRVATEMERAPSVEARLTGLTTASR